MTVVFDQIETATVETFTGSYGSSVFLEKSSIFMTGSFQRLVVGDLATTFFNSGTLVGKKYLISDYPKLYLLPNVQNISRRGFNKFSIGVCSEEQLADTVLSHPLLYSSINGINESILLTEGFVYNDTDGHTILGVPQIAPGTSVMLIVGTSSCVVGMTNGDEEQFCDNIWNYTGPYQSRYKNIRKFKEPIFRSPTVNKSHISRSASGNQNLLRNGQNFTSSYNSISYLTFITSSGAANALPTQVTIFADGAISGASVANLTAEFVAAPGYKLPLLTTKTLYDAYFGFGDGVHHFPRGFYEVPLLSSITYQINYAVELRGWKFGLYDAHPKFTTALYRYGRFGQVRDMLEQRKYTKFYNNNRFLSSAVRVSFTTSSAAFSLARDYVTATNPHYDTKDTGFYDYDYRCGHPFVDSEPTD